MCIRDSATFEKDLLIIVRNMQSLVSKMDSSGLGDGENLASFALSAKIFPDSWVNNFSDEWSGFHTPWNGYASITSFSPGVAWDGFRVYAYSVPQGACIKLVRKLTGYFAKSGNSLAFKHLQISSSDDGNADITADIDSTQIPLIATTTHCAASTTNLLMFTFDYTRIN